MRRKPHIIFLMVMLFLSCECCSSSRSLSSGSVSPLKFGLTNANSGIERYYVLKRTHEYALQHGLTVDYSNIRAIDIEIPKDGVSIPLGLDNDFSGVTFRVKNKSKHIFLFSLIQKGQEITVPSDQIDKGQFSGLFPNKGAYLLSIEDEKPWVENRAGYKYGHQRKDILLVKNRKSQNATIMPYNNPYSSPKCILYQANTYPFVFENIIFERVEGCRYRTNLIQVKGLNDVRIEGITIKTPESDLTGDTAISIQDCTNVMLNNITVDGTYSQSDDSGYAFSLNNVWNFKGESISGHANWGLFGDNNVNTAHLSKCTINRFDIHCYGRDVSFDNCIFQGMANQFSSLYGTLVFNHCRFVDATPVKIEYTYNCYTPFDLVIKDCSWHVTRYRNEIIYVGYVDDTINSRPELAKKSWPNIAISDFSVTTDPEVSKVMLFYIKGDISNKQKVDYISEISLDNVQIESKKAGKKVDFVITNAKVFSKKEVQLSVKRSTGVSRNPIVKSR